MRGDGFWVFWGEGLEREEGPVSTKVTYGEVRQLNCKLDNGNYEQNNQTDTNNERIKHEL